MTAAESWVADLVNTAEVDEADVHASVTVELDVHSLVTVRRVSSNDARPQGLAIAADSPFAINGSQETRVVLWSHTAPESVTLEAHSGRMTFWNVWIADRAVHAWIGEAGMRLEDQPDSDGDSAIRLLASDGFGDQPVDLEVDIDINAAPNHR